jgi:hypothetical protein
MTAPESQQERHVERRVVTCGFSAFTLHLEKHLIRECAVLDDFRIGPGHEGLRPWDHNVASFHYDGQVYFNLMAEVVRRTRILRTESVISGGY